MWSSPLLLLVLVFTLTNSPSRAATITTFPPSTTVRSTVTSTTESPPTTTSISTTTTSVVNSYATTSSTAQRVALAPSANASSGELSGSVDPALRVVLVPLVGPSVWTLVTSAPAQATLVCNGRSVVVASRVEVTQQSSCQLEITSSPREASLTWQLIPVQ